MAWRGRKKDEGMRRRCPGQAKGKRETKVERQRGDMGIGIGMGQTIDEEIGERRKESEGETGKEEVREKEEEREGRGRDRECAWMKGLFWQPTPIPVGQTLAWNLALRINREKDGERGREREKGGSMKGTERVGEGGRERGRGRGRGREREGVSMTEAGR